MLQGLQIITASVAGSMATVTSGAALQGRICEKMFVSGTSLGIVESRSRRNKNVVTFAKAGGASDLESVSSPAAVSVTGSILSLLASSGAAQALTKDDVNDAYTKAETVWTQVSTTAGTAFETTKGFLDKVFITVKPGLDVAVPYVRQTTETVTKLAAPLASDLAEEAQKALKSAGLDTQPGVEFAKTAAERTSKVLEGAQPLGSSVLESALAADPLFLFEAAGGIVLFYLLAPSLVSYLASKARGYAGDLAAAQALDLLLKQDYVLIDIRTEQEKTRSGVPSLPSNSKKKSVAVPVEEFASKIKGQLRNSRKVEAEVAALKIASLKRLNKGSNIVIIDESGDIAKIVARALTSQGFRNSYVITDGFKGGKGWLQSRLGTDNYNSSGSSFAEVLSPSRIIPAGSKRFGSTGSSPTRFNLLPGGADD